MENNTYTQMILEETEQHKKQRSQHKAEFISRFGEVREYIQMQPFINKGDLVIVENGYNIPVGPFEVLGFTDNGDLYLDWDCYWYAAKRSNVLLITTPLKK